MHSEIVTFVNINELPVCLVPIWMNNHSNHLLAYGVYIGVHKDVRSGIFSDVQYIRELKVYV